LANKTREIQEIILASPMGVSKLMDLLVDSREIIRNDVSFALVKAVYSLLFCLCFIQHINGRLKCFKSSPQWWNIRFQLM